MSDRKFRAIIASNEKDNQLATAILYVRTPVGCRLSLGYTNRPVIESARYSKMENINLSRVMLAFASYLTQCSAHAQSIGDKCLIL